MKTGFLRDDTTGALVVSGGGSSAAAAFRPESYGAIRNGVTDDTTAIKNCVAAAVAAGIADGTYYAEVQFTTGIYQLSGSLTQGGTTKGNALIPLPVLVETGQKFILVLRGSVDQAVQWHWNQTTVQTAGAVLRTTVAGTADATFGRASVIGGPTPEQGYGAVANLWSNMMIVVDGLGLVLPNNPAICGFDFRGVAEMNVPNAGVLTNATAATRIAATTAWQFGLATPQNNNNANSRVGKFVGVGQNFAAMINEHTVADSITAIYCVAGVELASVGQSTGHGIKINRLLVEASDVGIGVNDGAGEAAYPVKIHVGALDFEFIAFAIVNDPNGRMLGVIDQVSGIGDTNYLIDSPAGGVNYAVRGATNLRVYDKGRQKGVQATSPVVPATTVALRNPYFRDAFLHITGGTVTNVQITDSGGAAQSIATASPTTLLLPTGAYVTLTYSVAPTWKWTLL